MLDTVEPLISQPASSGTPSPSLNLIDLLEWNLPMFDEPTMPQMVLHHSGYVRPHTQAWSLEIQKYQAFIFVTPQYNWGYPAAIKNAIDYLYNEWKGKPAMIVSYGGHGGGKAAAQLNQVLCGVHMLPAATMPALEFSSKKTLLAASLGEQMELAGDAGMWAAQRPTICKAFEEMLELVGAAGVKEMAVA